MRKTMILAVSMLLLAACSDDRPPEKTVFDPLLQAKQKARDTEKKLQESAQQRQQQIERETDSEK